ncbi:hypothetical protein FOA52_003440 [Chlamydomonas sp. UWO 241]|nr:hypothetical protein FOA52_003440 [Chlamydomonas sp. UWO 241]
MHSRLTRAPLAMSHGPSVRITVRRTGERWRGLARAGEGEGPPQPVAMSTDEALSLLGVRAGASFDEVLSAKKSLVASGADEMEIEAAYDVVLGSRLKLRMRGENVSSSVRFADVPVTRREKVSASASAKGGAKTLSMPGGVSLRVAAPKQELAVQQGAVFGALATWSLLQACLEDPSLQLSDTAGLQLTIALAYCVYTLKENKGMSIGKAAGLSFAVLIAGALLGTLVHNWVRVDIVPIGAFGSPGVFCTEFVIAGMLAVALFLA